MMKKILFLFGMFATVALQTTMAADFPRPAAAYLFDDAVWSNTVKDAVGAHDGYWYSYRVECAEEVKPAFGGYKPGKFGNAAYFSGFHDHCGDGVHTCFHSSAIDQIFMSGNGLPEDVVGNSPDLYTSTLTNSITLAFWYKSARDYTKSNQPCESDPTEIGMSEDEYIVSFGPPTAGIVVSNYKGALTVTVRGLDAAGVEQTAKLINLTNQTSSAAKKTWQHVAIVLDKTAHELRVYMDGEIGLDYKKQEDAIVPTTIETMPLEGSSEIGAVNNYNCVTGISSFWGADAADACMDGARDGGKYRTAWPFAGWLDELVFYKDIALSEAQINTLMTTGLKSLLTLSSTPEITSPGFNVSPNPSRGKITISGLNSPDATVIVKVADISGRSISEKEMVNSKTIELNIPKCSGLYFISIQTTRGIFTNKIIIDQE